VVTPQLEGAIVTPGEPAATIEGGISAALLLVTEKCRFPVPLTVNGYFDELEFAAMVLLGSEVIVGAGNVPRAPRASMRPYPKVPSGGLLPSWVAPPCSAATSWDTVRLGNALRISAATAPAFGAEADVP